MSEIRRSPAECAMINNEGDFCPCIMEGVLGFLGKSWNIMIIGTLGNYAQLRYGELMGKLGNISPKTLSTRLKELGSIGLVERNVFAEIPPRVEYHLSPRGIDLYKRLIPLLEWATGDIHPEPH